MVCINPILEPEDRHRRPAGAVDRGDHPRRQRRHPVGEGQAARSGCAARRSCRAIGSVPMKPKGVLTADGWLRTGDIGVLRRAGLPEASRPQEGHGHRLRLQGLPQRGGGHRHDAIPACSRPPPSACPTSAPARRSSFSWSSAIRRSTAAGLRRISSRPLGELQGAAHHRISRPFAEKQYRQDSAQGIALSPCAWRRRAAFLLARRRANA